MPGILVKGAGAAPPAKVRPPAKSSTAIVAARPAAKPAVRAPFRSGKWPPPPPAYDPQLRDWAIPKAWPEWPTAPEETPAEPPASQAPWRPSLYPAQQGQEDDNWGQWRPTGQWDNKGKGKGKKGGPRGPR